LITATLKPFYNLFTFNKCTLILEESEEEDWWAEQPSMNENSHHMQADYHHDKSRLQNDNFYTNKEQPWYYEDSFEEELHPQHSPPFRHPPAVARHQAQYRPQLVVAASPTPTRRSATDPNLSSVLRPPLLPRRRLPPTPRQPSNLDVDKLQEQQKGNYLSKSSTDPNMLEATVSSEEASKQAVLEFNFPRLNFSPSHKHSSSGPLSMMMRPFQNSMLGYVHGNGVGAMPGGSGLGALQGGSGISAMLGASGTGGGLAAAANGVRTLHTRRALPMPGFSELERLRGGRQLPSLAQHRGAVGGGDGWAGGDGWPGGGGRRQDLHGRGYRGMGVEEEEEFEEDWC
jgi:hypothetical protein